MFCIINGLKIHYILKGAGTPFVVLPGWGGSTHTWSVFEREFNLSGYQLCIVDLPGFGQSAEPPRPWTVTDYADFTNEFCTKMRFSKIILCGHSHGGRVAVYLGAHFPQLIKKLILLAPAGVKHRAPLKVRSIKFVSGLLPRRLKDGAGKVFKPLIYALAGSHDYEKASPIMRETMQKTLNFDITPLLPHIIIPTLLFWGTIDRMVPVSDINSFRQIPGLVINVIERAGHALHRDHSKPILTRIKDWL